MATATRKPPKTSETRKLLEWSASVDSSAPALKIDREKKVIYGVKVLGRFSRNSHGMANATGGTEYSLPCMRDALPLYEGCEVLSKEKNHAGADGVEQIVGVLRNARLEGDSIRADLHYYDSHPMSSRILEDVERSIGAVGLSHAAVDDPRQARFDSAAKRLVIGKLVKVDSVDLVRRPASNRNLWESEEPKMNTTLRKLFEALKLTPVREGWRKKLLEDDAMTPAMDAEVAAPEGSDDGVAAGIKAACMAIIDDDSLDAGGKVAKLKTLLTAHEKMTGKEEPEPVKESEEPPKKKPDDDKNESEKDAEIAKLKHGLAVRKLCEELKITPDPVLLESAEGISDIKAVRRLFEREKARGPGPKSSPPPTTPPVKKPASANNRPFAERIRS